jgi:predicted phosphodiesterase
MPSLTRRQWLRQSATTLLAAGVWPGALAAEGSGQGEAFSFVVLNDIHYLDNRCGRWLEGVVRLIRKRPEKIELCLLAGDLAEHGNAEQLVPVRDHFRTLGIPVHVVIGNHDYQSLDDRGAFLDLFPGSLNYTFEHRGWQVLALDSSHGRRSQVAVQSATLRWLDETLPKLDRKRPMMVVTHFPLGPWVIYRATNADAVLDRFRDFNLQAVFSGHFHGFTERKVRTTTLTTNRCCSFSRRNHDGSKEKGFFLCQAKDGRITRTFVEVPVAPVPAQPANR